MRVAVITASLAVAILLTPAADADVIVDGFNSDSLSSSSGVVAVALDDQSALGPVTLQNTTTGESYSLSFAGTLDGVASADAQLNAASSGSRLGMNALINSSDETQSFDGKSGAAEGLRITFSSSARMTSANFNEIGWSGDSDYEAVQVFRNGTLTNTLFSDDVDTSAAVFTSAVGAIASSGGDDFTGLAWDFSAGDSVEFRMTASSLTAKNGYTIEQFTLSAVPEPNCLGLLGFAVVLGCQRRRRS